MTPFRELQNELYQEKTPCHKDRPANYLKHNSALLDSTDVLEKQIQRNINKLSNYKINISTDVLRT